MQTGVFACDVRLERLVKSTKNKHKTNLCPLLETMGNFGLKINVDLNSFSESKIPHRHHLIHIFSFPLSLARDFCKQGEIVEGIFSDSPHSRVNLSNGR